MVVIIPSYNNAAWCIKNIDSVLQQVYQNYRVIFIDDCSTDATFEMVKARVQELGAQNRVTLIHNSFRRGALANIYSAVHTCQDQEIIALVDGDDWLAHNTVLTTVNSAYVDPTIWLTYGQFKVHPDNRIGECKDIPRGISQNNVYREYDWCSSHLRTFYAALFKQIKLQDLLYKGSFFEVTWDMAMLFPMLEMSGGRFACIKDVLYIYNCGTESNDFKTKLLLQIHCNKLISSKKKYEPLKTKPVTRQGKISLLMLMFSHDHPRELYAFLETYSKYAQQVDALKVLYQVSDETTKKMYDAVQEAFPAIECVRCNPDTFKSSVNGCLALDFDYVVLARDGMVIKEPINFDYCAHVLEKTGALGFYLSLGKNVTKHRNLVRNQQHPSLVWLERDVYVWQFADGEYDWRIPYSCSMSVYRKAQIALLCADLQYHSWHELERMLVTARVDLHNVGLVYGESKVAQMAL